MKNIRFLLGMVLLIPAGVFAQQQCNSSQVLCLTWVSFTASPSGCNVNLSWSYNQCIDGTYYVEYSPDAVNFYPIGSVASGPANSTIQSYNYTDPNGCPSSSFSGNVYYRIRFLTTAGCYTNSSIQMINRSNCSGCPTRCSGLPNKISMLGDDAICSTYNATYSLNPAYPAAWSVSPTQYTTTTGGDPYSNFTVTNNTSNNYQPVTVSANIYGCRTVSRTIYLNTCETGCPTLNGISIYNDQGPSQYWCTNAVNNGFTLSWNGNIGTANVEIRTWPAYTLVATYYGVSGSFNIQSPLLPPSAGSYAILATNTCNSENTAGIIIDAQYCNYGRSAPNTDSLKSLGLQAFPNPAINTINLAANKASSLQPGKPATIRLYNIFTGQLQKTWNIASFTGTASLNIADIRRGQYVLVIETAQSVQRIPVLLK